jgi:hypothetical protein
MYVWYCGRFYSCNLIKKKLGLRKTFLAEIFKIKS